MLQALREALRQCRCACVRACVCVCMLFEGEGGGTGKELSWILLSQFQVRQGEAVEDPGAAAPCGGGRGETLVKQSGTLVGGQLDPRQTQPETPCTIRQLLDKRREGRTNNGQINMKTNNEIHSKWITNW